LCLQIHAATLGERNVTKRAAEKSLKYKDFAKEIQHMWTVKTKVIPLITGNWKLLKIIQKMPEEHTGNAGYQGTTDNSNTEHHTQSLESTNAKVQKIQPDK
jgi:hypothetical protein